MIDPLNNKNEIVWDRWCKNAERYPNKDAIIHWVAGEKPYRWTFFHCYCLRKCTLFC